MLRQAGAAPAPATAHSSAVDHMKAEQIKVSPAGSETILKFILEETLQKPFFRDRDTGEIRQLAEKAAPEMPEDYLPDTYLDFDLSGGGKPFLTFLLNSQECNLVNAQTQGRYFAESAVPAVLAPEQYRRVAGLGLVDGKSFPFEADHTLISPREYLYTKNFGTPTDGEAACSGAEKLIERLQAFPVKYEAYHRAGICTVSFDTGKRSPKNRFSRKDCADGLLSVLAEQGVPEETLSGLKDLSRNYAMPFYDTLNGYREWVCCADIAYFSVSFCGEKAVECRVGLLLTDKGMLSRGEGLKPTQAYQWHITDNCDQRCKHCYLFAEDALLKCVTTPWDMLIRTLDECTLDAARRHGRPMFAVTGGDPILHPRFWDLAEEIHRRGIRWLMMGNPFHLTPEVCTRLKQLGVLRYQMSLDGLEPFHDYMRKPGSFRATLAAIKLLNDAGIESQIMSTASKMNLDDILSLMDVVAEHNAYSFTFARYCATSPEKAEDYPSPEEYRRFLERYYDKSKALNAQGLKTRFIQKDHLFTLLRWERGEFTVPAFSKADPDMVCDGCHLGRTGSILANGDVVACRRMESTVGNVWKESLSQLETCEEMQRYADVKEIEKCKDCELLNWCRGCRAVGFNATGDLHGADPCCWKE